MKAIKITILIMTGVVSLYYAIVSFLYFRYSPYCEAPLELVTFDGTNSPYHPTVEYFPNEWNGWNYYMIETPCSPILPKGAFYHDQNENPNLHVSNDGLHFYNPMNSPIDTIDADGVKALDYLSDPDIVMVSDTMEVWYRINHRRGDKSDNSHVCLLRNRSVDGVAWLGREVMVDFDKDCAFLSSPGIMMSPSMSYKDGLYGMWYVWMDLDQTRNYHVCYAESQNGHDWSKIGDIDTGSVIPWHIDVLVDDGIFWLIVYSRNQSLTLFRGDSPISFTFCKELLCSNDRVGSFYSNGLYRSALIKDELGYKLYFSAKGNGQTHIGLMAGPTPESMKIISIDGMKFRTYSQYSRFIKDKIALRLYTILK